jgi:hypothetical protein
MFVRRKGLAFRVMRPPLIPANGSTLTARAERVAEARNAAIQQDHMMLEWRYVTMGGMKCRATRRVI